MNGRRRHLISISDLSNDDLNGLVDRGVEYAAGRARAQGRLADTVVGIYFRKTSTRTRTAFSSAALRLGAHIISYGPNDLQENTGESVEDTAAVLSRMLDGLVTRTAGSPEEMRAFATQARMSVINAMSADEHPTQALADLTTLKQQFGCIDGLRVLYVGEGNNTASALALALARYRGTELHLRTPPGYGLPAAALHQAVRCAARSRALVSERHDLERLPAEVDVVYTTRWRTTGTSKPDPNWRDVFAPFQVDRCLMDRFPAAVFMHDLPAHRDEEVTAGVLDGPRSIAFDQAENKLHSALAVLEWGLAA
jgi:ornithine carbamoyltransferase